MRCFILLFVVCGLLTATVFASIDAAKRSLVASGRVIAVGGGDVHTVIKTDSVVFNWQSPGDKVTVRFTDQAGQQHDLTVQYSAQKGLSVPVLHIGDGVEVAYPRADPADARLKIFNDHTRNSLFHFIVVLGALLVATTVFGHRFSPLRSELAE